MNNYYVYIYWRLDINEIFYVGMGHNNRWKVLYNRKKHFKNIINKHPIACEIVKDNLTEEQAHGIECWLINELVFKYGYSIDIPNNRSNEKGYHLVNQTWGGEGTSGMNPFENKTEEEIQEWRRKESEVHKGKNPLKNLTKEERIKINEKISKANKGKKHSKEAKEKMSNAQKGRIHSEETRKKIGEGNKGKKHSEETRKKMSEIKKKNEQWKGENNPFYGTHRNDKNNPNAKSVICLTTKRIFFTAKEGAEFYKMKSQGHISSCCNGKIKFAGKFNNKKLVWRKII